MTCGRRRCSDGRGRRRYGAAIVLTLCPDAKTSEVRWLAVCALHHNATQQNAVTTATDMNNKPIDAIVML